MPDDDEQSDEPGDDEDRRDIDGMPDEASRQRTEVHVLDPKALK